MGHPGSSRTPVIMFHAVGLPVPGWKWPTMTTQVDLFEKQIKLLIAGGFRTISLDRYRDLNESGRHLEARRVALTFDDGYLDNWVFAYPILKREGWRGTIYVNPEFIDPGEEPRLNLDDVWSGKCSLKDLQVHGFLNRAELRCMQESGVMEIGSHSMSHTWWPIGHEVVDFHRPDIKTYWLAWNARPDRKFAYLNEDQSGFVPWGAPIHRNGRSLGIRRYYPDPGMEAVCTTYVAENGGRDFFSRRNWREELEGLVAGLSGGGRPETDEEMLARYRYEILDSKQVLEEICGAPVVHFCWPGGAYCDASWEIAQEAGFRTICVAGKDPARYSSDDPRLVRRIGCGHYFAFGNRRYPTSDPRFLRWECELQLGIAGGRWPLRVAKFLAAARAGFSPPPTRLP